MFESCTIVNLLYDLSEGTAKRQSFSSKLEAGLQGILETIDINLFITHIFPIDYCCHFVSCDIWKSLHNINHDPFIRVLLYLCHPLSNKTLQYDLFCLNHCLKLNLSKCCGTCFPFDAPLFIGWHKTKRTWHHILIYALEHSSFVYVLVLCLECILCHCWTINLKNKVPPDIK